MPVDKAALCGHHMEVEEDLLCLPKVIASVSIDLNSPERGFWNELFLLKSFFLSVKWPITTYTDLVDAHYDFGHFFCHARQEL